MSDITKPTDIGPTTTDNVLFVLGYPDPEMDLIQSILSKLNLNYAFARTQEGRRVSPYDEWDSVSVDVRWGCGDRKVEIDKAHIVAIDCVKLLQPEPHYMLNRESYYLTENFPKYFLSLSLIGRVLDFLLNKLGIKEEDYAEFAWEIPLAAANLYPILAYAGKFEGVDPKDFKYWRAMCQAEEACLTTREMLRQQALAVRVLETFEKKTLGGRAFRDTRLINPLTAGPLWEVALQRGEAVQWTYGGGDGNPRILELSGASPELVKDWVYANKGRLSHLKFNIHLGSANGWIKSE